MFWVIICNERVSIIKADSVKKAIAIYDEKICENREDGYTIYPATDVLY